jgi:hypothetical protein
MRYLYRSKTCKLRLSDEPLNAFEAGFRLSICERIEADSANGRLARPHRHGCGTSTLKRHIRDPGFAVDP